MLRPIFRKLEPGQRQNIVHWAMELVVVVVGVLLALWAQEWVEGRRQASDDELILDTLKYEVGFNLMPLGMFSATEACSLARMGELRDRLEKGEAAWSGRGNYDNGQESGLYPQLIRLPGFMPIAVQIDRATQNGAVERADIVHRLLPIYSQLALFAEARSQSQSIVKEMAVLTRPVTLTADMRIRYLEKLGKLDGEISIMRSVAKQVPEYIPESYETVVRDYQQQFDESVAKLRKEMGSCVVDIDLLTGKPKI